MERGRELRRARPRRAGCGMVRVDLPLVCPFALSLRIGVGGLTVVSLLSGPPPDRLIPSLCIYAGVRCGWMGSDQTFQTTRVRGIRVSALPMECDRYVC